MDLRGLHPDRDSVEGRETAKSNGQLFRHEFSRMNVARYGSGRDGIVRRAFGFLFRRFLRPPPPEHFDCRSNDTERQNEHHQRQQQPVSELLPVLKLLKILRQISQHESTDERPCRRARAAQDHHQQEPDGIREGEYVR